MSTENITDSILKEWKKLYKGKDNEMIKLLETIMNDMELSDPNIEPAINEFIDKLIGQSKTQIISALQITDEALSKEANKVGKRGGNESEERQKEIDILRDKIAALLQALDALTVKVEDPSKGKDDKITSEKKPSAQKTDEDKLKARKDQKTAESKMWKDTAAVIGSAKKLTGEILDAFDEIDEGTKKIVSSAFVVAETTFTLISTISTYSAASVGATTAVAATAATSIQKLEKASLILQIISAALMVAQALASFIINLVSNDKKADKDIANKQKSVDDLKKKYEKLGEEINNSYGYAASDKIEEQNANLYEQQKLIKEQMALEEDKKKIDKSKMNDYQKQLDENEKKIKANETAAVDAIFGADLESAIDDFATAYLEVWDSAEGKVKAQQDVVKNMIKGIIKELVKEGIADKVKALRERIAEAMKDGGISDAEDAQIQAEANAITAKMDADTKMMDKYLKDDPEREASKRGFGAITQESADELNGRFTSIQYNTDEITKSVRTLALNSDSVLKSLLGIQNNTSHCSRLETIESDMSAVKVGIGIMTTKGVKML